MFNRKFEWLEHFDFEDGLHSYVNLLVYAWKRNNWIVSPWRWVDGTKRVDIDRPIFLVGNQGAGLTFVSRMLRRKKGVVSVTGNHEYWSGADEMQRAMAPRLPAALRLTGGVLGGEPPHQRFSPPRSWTYASDDLFQAYHMTEENYKPEWSKKLRKIISECILRFSNNRENARFIDKSQIFTLKIRLVNELIRDLNPHFVLITRNPYVACYRAASGKALDMRRYSDLLKFGERLKICSSHWKNAIGNAIKDGEKIDNFMITKFENVIKNTKKEMENICNFLGIEFSERMIPSKNDEVPLGTRFEGKWYPIRRNVNKKYYGLIGSNHIEMVDNKVGKLARRLNYEPPFGDKKT